MSLNVKCLMTLNFPAFYWCFLILSIPLNMDVKNKPNHHKQTPTAISYTLEKRELQKHFCWTSQNVINFQYSKSTLPFRISYTWMPILHSMNDWHKSYCMHHYIKLFRNPSSTFSLALCALSSKNRSSIHLYQCRTSEYPSICMY